MKNLLRRLLIRLFGSYDVIISGYYGYDSLGDDTVLAMITTALREKMPECTIGVLSGSSGKHQAGIHRICRKNPLAVLWALLRCRLLISGGGSLLQDATSSRSLRYYTGIIRIARFFGAKIFIYANGIGPLAHPGYASAALRCANMISVRDPDSRDAVLKMGIPPEQVYLSADPVFLLQPPSPKKDIPRRQYFVVSLRKCKGCFIDEAALAAACSRLQAEGMRAVFVSMQDTWDLSLCRRICRRCGGEMAAPMSGEALAGLLAGAQFVIGMRLHSILLAAISGTPAVALSYDCKIDSAMDYLEQPTALDAFFFTEEMLLEACRKARSRGEHGRAVLAHRAALFGELAWEDAQRAAHLLEMHPDSALVPHRTAASRLLER